jgi:murein DD-endopeptidase MepM/ murein hydrolase activator NlpD
MADILTPALGESVAEASIAKWTKKVGDAVKKDEVLVELETDKVSLEVVAPADGVVVEARRWGGYGNWLRIRHNNGLESGYGHLSRYGAGIRAGQRVSQGQIVAYVGSTGASTGPHLHYEVRMDGEAVDPGRFLRASDRVAGVR